MKIQRLARKGILELASYVPGKTIEEVQKELGRKNWIKLASNENLFGPSLKAIAAIRKELHNIFLYPEGPCTDLRRALARKFSLPEKSIVLFNGLAGLIPMVVAGFVDEGDEVVMADATFAVYANATKIMGGKTVKVALKDFTHDLPAMLRKVTRKTKLIFVCNPNNPTGTVVRRKELDYFLSQLPNNVVTVLDEAYCEFVEDQAYPYSLSYVRKGRQVILLRTFSKVYGLAGLRIGFALGKADLVDCLNRVRDPFAVNRLAQTAALAALNDQDHTKRSIQMVHEGKQYLYKELDKMGLFYVPTQANFIFIDFGRDSEEVSHALLREGIIVRPGHSWNYPTFARVTIAKREHLQRFIRALRKILNR